MSKYVLDASAVLALLNRETGQDRVEAVLGDSIISAVNFCEFLRSYGQAD
jgi:PIN domain nuclease of toxin-antitoxin system